MEDRLKSLKRNFVLVEMRGKNEIRLQFHFKPDEPLLKFHFYKEQNHPRPHFHIRWKDEFSASIAIDKIEVLESDMPKKHTKYALLWAEENKEYLLEQWKRVQNGKQPVKYSV